MHVEFNTKGQKVVNGRVETTKKTFKFNGNWNNLDQVKPFYKQFKQVKDNMNSYPYNDNFIGKIDGLAGDDEKTAIYLLQQLDTDNKRQTKIDELLNNGYKKVIPQSGGSCKYESIVKVGNNFSKDGVDEYPKAKIWFADGHMFIVPKGHRTRGYNVWPDSAVYVK